MSSNLKVNSLVPATGTEIGIGTTGGNIDFRCPATFGGNVTIGGTLTYDEVINIDSIGIVTARSGLKVTGGQLDVGSNIKAGNAGVITATTFVGALSGTTGTFTGDVDIADKIRHTGDTDTAIRFPAADQIQLETGGTARVTVTNSTTTVANNATFSGATTQIAGNYLDIQNNKKLRLGTNGDCAFYFNGAATIIETDNKIIHMQTDASIRLQKNSPQAHMLIANAGGSVDLYHNGTKKLETDLDGIRIGTGGGDNTIVDLHNASYDNGVIQYYNGSINLKTGSSNGDRQISLHTAGTERFLIDSSGNVTVKTNDVKLSGSGTLRVNSGSTTGTLNLDGGATNHGGEINLTGGSNGGRIQFRTGQGSGQQTEKMRLDENGRLIIGTTTEGEVSADNLTIADSGNCGMTIRSGTSSWASLFFSDATSGTDEYTGAIEYKHSDNYLRFRTAATERLRIMSDGRTGINIEDARFGQGNGASQFYQRVPMLGVQGSIAIGNLSSTATDQRELAFYRRAGSTAGSPISNHHMGRIAWYGSSNDTSFPDKAWSLECTPNGGGWTAGSNRYGYLSFVNRDAEKIRITSDSKVSIGFAGAPTSKVHIKGNSDNGSEDATVTIDDIDDTAGSKEPMIAFDGNGTRQGRILSSDLQSVDAGGMSFGVGSSNNTVLQLTSNRSTTIHRDVRGWATVRYSDGTGMRQHVRMHYSPGNAVQQQTLLRIRRHWWGWGHYKIRCKAIYYNSSLESTYYVNGHGSGGNSYSVVQETFGGDAMNNTWSCSISLSASNNSPGSSGTWYCDVIANIPNYYYAIFWVEAWGSSYTTDPTTGVSNSINTYCLM